MKKPQKPIYGGSVSRGNLLKKQKQERHTHRSCRLIKLNIGLKKEARKKKESNKTTPFIVHPNFISSFFSSST